MFLHANRAAVETKALLAALKALDKEHGGTMTNSELTEWSDKTTPLLAFNPEHQKAFIKKRRTLSFLNQPESIRVAALEAMVSTLKMAIAELEYPVAKAQFDLTLPEKITVRWLQDHVPMRMWGAFFTLLLAAFVLGASLSCNQTISLLIINIAKLWGLKPLE